MVSLNEAADSYADFKKEFDKLNLEVTNALTAQKNSPRMRWPDLKVLVYPMYVWHCPNCGGTNEAKHEPGSYVSCEDCGLHFNVYQTHDTPVIKTPKDEGFAVDYLAGLVGKLVHLFDWDTAARLTTDVLQRNAEADTYRVGRIQFNLFCIKTIDLDERMISISGYSIIEEVVLK